ncbi:ATP-dependent rRNA helicase spb4 [Savitreella phatthalungensis]
MSRSWDKLEPTLSLWVREAVRALGFDSMTPVQASTLPLFMGHKDVVVEAVTGSGKTLAFLLPVVERLIRRSETLPRHHVGALIICPTRELAMQIHTVFEGLLEHSIEGDDPPLLSAQLLIGGATSVQQDVAAYRSNSSPVLIGTPGRIDDFMKSTASWCSFKELEMLVMDEADRLLDMGFSDVLTGIISRLPKQRRTGLFSATMTDAVSSLVRTGLRNPVKVVVQVRAKIGAANGEGETRRAPTSLSIEYMVMHAREKPIQLLRLLTQSAEDGLPKSIVYLPTCAGVDYFAPLLASLKELADFTVVPLHGKQAPAARARNYKAFTALPARAPAVLVTTDLAARGLDFPDVDLVVQLEPPSDPSAFTHRCGRAGRAGRRGKAVVFLNHGREEDFIGYLEVKKIPITKIPTTQATPDETLALLHAMRRPVLTDRDLLDKGVRAFVSHVRMYQKHQLSFVFRLGELDLVGMGMAYALARLPRMPELSRGDGPARDVEGVVFPELETAAIPYADADREAKRQRELAKPENTSTSKKPRLDKTQDREERAWSKNKAAKVERLDRRDKRHKKRDAQRGHHTTTTAEVVMDDNDSDQEDDWKDLVRENKRRLQSQHHRHNDANDDDEAEADDIGKEASGGMTFDDL